MNERPRLILVFPHHAAGRDGSKEHHMGKLAQDWAAVKKELDELKQLVTDQGKTLQTQADTIKSQEGTIASLQQANAELQARLDAANMAVRDLQAAGVPDAPDLAAEGEIAAEAAAAAKTA